MTWSAAVVVDRMNRWVFSYANASMPSVFGATWGCDYAAPTELIPDLNKSWSAAGLEPLHVQYATFRQFFDRIDASNVDFKRVRGERPNLWWVEGAPTHHQTFADLRGAARTLPQVQPCKQMIVFFFVFLV